MVARRWRNDADDNAKKTLFGQIKLPVRAGLCAFRSQHALVGERVGLGIVLDRVDESKRFFIAVGKSVGAVVWTLL